MLEVAVILSIIAVITGVIVWIRENAESFKRFIIKAFLLSMLAFLCYSVYIGANVGRYKVVKDKNYVLDTATGKLEYKYGV